MERASRVLPVFALSVAAVNFLMALDIFYTLIHSGNEFLTLLVGGFVLYLSFVTAWTTAAVTGNEGT